MMGRHRSRLSRTVAVPMKSLMPLSWTRPGVLSRGRRTQAAGLAASVIGVDAHGDDVATAAGGILARHVSESPGGTRALTGAGSDGMAGRAVASVTV